MKKALVIQEDIIILKILENLLRLKNFDCKAIRTLSDLEIEDQTVNYNIIISDILFDGIAPLDFVFQIQEIILHESLIIVSNMGQKKVQQEVLASDNVSGFLSVPIDMDLLEHLIT
jgi:two-component system, OmpR family, lantibiotic biosynthesis response regulator NisR/SpaR